MGERNDLLIGCTEHELPRHPTHLETTTTGRALILGGVNKQTQPHSSKPTRKKESAQHAGNVGKQCENPVSPHGRSSRGRRIKVVNYKE